MKAYPEESNGIRDHLVMHGFLDGNHESQIRLDSRKSLVDAKLKVETVAEKALHLEAVTKTEEEER